MKYLLIIVTTVVLTLTARWYVQSFIFVTPRTFVEPLEVVLRWIGGSSCTEMDAEERARELRVVQVLREFPFTSIMRIGAVRHLGRDQYRRTGATYVRLCPASDLDPEIAELALAQDIFSRAYLHADETRLARRLGPRDPRIVEAVAKSAFNSFAIETEYPESKADIRSLARVTLAEFGAAAAQWSERAFEAINADDALGTSAAQIAVATMHPQALEEISKLLDAILQKHPTDPIPRKVRNRFYELAHALAQRGPQALPFARPIMRIMTRKVESWAPPFGMLSLRPRRMCRVLELIGGPEAEEILTQEVCRPKIDTYEQ